MTAIIAIGLGILLLWVICKVLKLSIKIFWKLFINALAGGLILLLINIFGVIIGLSIPITFLSALVVGLLGVPGVIILLLLGL